MKKLESLASLERELDPLQRVHFHILIQARQDYLTARNCGYINENGEVEEKNLQYKKGGNALMGGFNTPLYKKELYQLVEYWKSNVPFVSLEVLNIVGFDITDILTKLNYSFNSRK
jgi:hypothetical protein|tara:strand:+ start:675 stop:1022 length:348 start_codon:yes stop_codon:yes gene_type:complete